MELREITSGATLEGVEPASVVTVVAAIPIPADSLQLVYRLPDGALRERLLTRADEGVVTAATTARPWSFEGDGAAFQLTAEAKRIDLAFLFDPMMAIVLVENDAVEGPFYLKKPFEAEPGLGCRR
jgi:hypothetical protein